jgi:hypothetical protein
MLSSTKPGLALRAITPSVSAAAALVRAGDIAANPGEYEIAVRPRSCPDQLELPCCVSCSLTVALESLDSRTPPLASIFHYHVTRFDNSGADPAGEIFLSDGLATLTNNGVCRLDLHNEPFTESGAEVTPSPTAYADALTRALGMANLQVHFQQPDGPSRVAWAREQLRLDRPIILSFFLPATYPNSFLDRRFTWLDPNRFPRAGNGHCVLAFGYDDARQSFHIQDSMGPQMFDRGCWWMGYRVIDSPIVQDVYSLFP